LVQNLTALENVELASEICQKSLNPKKVLESVDLSDRMNNFPSQLSGGEQQRVAIARALAKNPRLLLCDEPTGALDDKTGIQILKVLQKANTESGMTVVIITHNLAITQIAQKVIAVRNGSIEGIYRNTNPRKAEDITL
jgi:putative ABC transport system ATP-binding protein